MQHTALNIRTDNNTIAFADFDKVSVSNEQNFLLSPYDLNSRFYAFREFSPNQDWEYFCNELEYE